ncbi:MAG TPA: DUF4384 domain-containing protein [Pirellulales bacterium]|nr:DUF4384 domain-containing protein [Pirellulales bacterium]
MNAVPVRLQAMFLAARRALDVRPMRGARLAPFVAVLCLATAVRGDADEPSVRDLVRKYVQDHPNGAAVAEGAERLPGNIRKVVAMEYTVLLRKGDDEEPIDPHQHQFQLGDQIRVQVQPLSDLYIYIFHEGSSGRRSCLLPADDETAPLAKRDEILKLPNDGGYFQFEKPAGDERLIVVATEERVDLKVLSGLVFKKPDEELSAEEQAIQKKLKARAQKTLKSIREQQTQGTKFRGMFNDDVLTKMGGELKDDESSGVLEEPPHGREISTFSMSVSAKKQGAGELFVSIPLKSAPPAAGKR